MVYNIRDIRYKMNRAGHARAPFLFGVDFEMKEGFFIPTPLLQQEVFFSINNISNTELTVKRDPPGIFTFESYPEDYNRYSQRFSLVMNGLKRGDSQLTNLTIRTPIRTDLSLEDMYHHSNAPYKLYIPGEWVCFSPECFVRIDNNRICTFPMKGTIDAGLPNAGEVIMNDEKEMTEHIAVVNLLREELHRIADHVEVPRFRYIEEVETNKGVLLQVSSEVTGRLPDNWREKMGDLLFELLPAGSVSGVPKEAALRLIREAETTPRGFYTGVAGYFDGKSLDSFVLIRFIEQRGMQLFFRSGGGITARSLGRKEYEEAIQKIYLPFSVVQ